MRKCEGPVGANDRSAEKKGGEGQLSNDPACPAWSSFVQLCPARSSVIQPSLATIQCEDDDEDSEPGGGGEGGGGRGEGG